MNDVFLANLEWSEPKLDARFFTKTVIGKSAIFYDDELLTIVVVLTNSPTDLENSDNIVCHYVLNDTYISPKEIHPDFTIEADEFSDLVRLTDADKLFFDFARFRANIKLAEFLA